MNKILFVGSLLITLITLSTCLSFFLQNKLNFLFPCNSSKYKDNTVHHSILKFSSFLENLERDLKVCLQIRQEIYTMYVWLPFINSSVVKLDKRNCKKVHIFCFTLIYSQLKYQTSTFFILFNSSTVCNEWFKFFPNAVRQQSKL